MLLSAALSSGGKSGVLPLLNSFKKTKWEKLTQQYFWETNYSSEEWSTPSHLGYITNHPQYWRPRIVHLTRSSAASVPLSGQSLHRSSSPSTLQTWPTTLQPVTCRSFLMTLQSSEYRDFVDWCQQNILAIGFILAWQDSLRFSRCRGWWSLYNIKHVLTHPTFHSK